MKLGFIGCGNMAGAIIRGIIASGAVLPQDITGADLSAEAREKIQAQSGICVTADNAEVVRNSDIVFLTVKPQYLEDVIFGIREAAGPEHLFVSIAAGRSVSWIEERFGDYPVRLVRHPVTLHDPAKSNQLNLLPLHIEAEVVEVVS